MSLYVRDIKESVLILVLFVNGAHERRGRRQNLVDEDEDGLLGRKLDALADDIDELADGQVCGNQILLLVDSCDVRLFDLFADHLQETNININLQTGSADKTRKGGDERSREVLTGIRSAYFWRMRSASALRFSKGCSSLNLDRMAGAGIYRLLCGVLITVGSGKWMVKLR